MGRAIPDGTFPHRTVIEHVGGPIGDARIAGRLAALSAHERAHRCAALEEGLHEVRADESRGTRYDGDHVRKVSYCAAAAQGRVQIGDDAGIR